MACMTHECYTCRHEWSNNQAFDTCPKCGSYNVFSDSDEPSDYDSSNYFDDPIAEDDE
jgi:predicted  nucleic acid-binding Zn-ribbon protein